MIRGENWFTTLCRTPNGEVWRYYRYLHTWNEADLMGRASGYRNPENHYWPADYLGRSAEAARWDDGFSGMFG